MIFSRRRFRQGHSSRGMVEENGNSSATSSSPQTTTARPRERGVDEMTYTSVQSGTNLKGEFDIKGDIHIHGNLEGSAQCDGQFYVCESGKFCGDAAAADVVVSGYFEGSIECRSLTITTSGRFRGIASAEAFTIEGGGSFEGESKRRMPDNVTRLTHESTKGRGSR